MKKINRVQTIYVILAIGVTLLDSCKNLDPEPVSEVKIGPKRYMDSLIGKVSSYEEESGIILVQTYSRIKPKSSDVFITRGVGGKLGTITLSGQSNSFFLAAEKVSGLVEAGDSVYRRRFNKNFEENSGEGSAEFIDEEGPQDNVGTMGDSPASSEDPLAVP